MKEPQRWCDDPAASLELRELLGHAPRAQALDANTRLRMARRLSRYLTVPLVLTSWLTIKTAAASLAITAGAVTLGAVVVHEVRVLGQLETPLPAVTSSVRPSGREPAVAQVRELTPGTEKPVSVASAHFPDLDELPSAPTVASANPRSRGVVPAVGAVSAAKPQLDAPTDPLRTEAAMLEMARRALVSSPSEALAIAEEHRTQFPSGKLGLERELIRVDALLRLGRRSEAQALAQNLRKRGGLYSERVNRLLETAQ
jgi:hypothetical protein